MDLVISRKRCVKYYPRTLLALRASGIINGGSAKSGMIVMEKKLVCLSKWPVVLIFGMPGV